MSGEARVIPNCLTVDLEDWVQSVLHAGHPLTNCFIRNTYRLLELLAEHKVRATFFVLGLAARKAPALIREIHEAKHEVQSHGFAHQPIHCQAPHEFRADVERSKKLLEDIVGTAVIGFRAPAFSITHRSLWALDVLGELGFEYDSSVFPVRMRRYGIHGAPRLPHFVSTRRGRELLEIPVASWKLPGLRVPCGGGGYFRLWPYSCIRRCMRQFARAGDPATVYMHPYELAPEEFDELAAPVPRFIRLTQGLGRRGIAGKLDRLLREFSFSSIRNLRTVYPVAASFSYDPRSESPTPRLRSHIAMGGVGAN